MPPSKFPKLRSLFLSTLLVLQFSSPSRALVEPEVEAWQELVAAVEESIPLLGSSIPSDAVQGVGNFASSMAFAPLSDLMQELELRRGLKFKYFTPWHVKDKTALRFFIQKALEKEYTPEKALKEEALLKALGLVALDFRIVPFTEELLTDAVAGVYDPDTDQFFLVDMERGQDLKTKFMSKAGSLILGDMGSTVIIHELDHALGGQHFPLKKTFEQITEQSTLDRRMAALAVVEGDATFVMMDHQYKYDPKLAGSKTQVLGADYLTDMLEFLTKFPVPLPGMGKYSEAPLFFQKSLVFPYYSGAEFITKIRWDNGWESVNEVYKELPASTEQIYHPSRYRYQSTPPDIPDFSKFPEPFGKWETVTDDVGGEFLLRVVLEQYGVDNFRVAADGWNGDKIRVFRHKETGGLGFYWVIRWDNNIDAREFYQSLASHLPFVVEQEEHLTTISLAFTPKELKKLRDFLPFPKT